MNSVTTVTTKGQITMPAYIRKRYSIKPADMVMFSIREDNSISLEKIPPVNSLFGSLQNKGAEPLTTKQMDKLVSEGMFSKDQA